MISTIEGPRADETLPSLIARNLSRVPIPSRASAARELLGNDRALLFADLPGRIGFLEESLGRRLGLTAHELIDATTMLPLLRPFLTPSCLMRIEQSMIGTRGHPGQLVRVREVHNRYWHLRYCAKCRAEDLEAGDGVTWWRRVHQVPGVECCPVHGSMLIESQFYCGENWKVDYPCAQNAEAASAPGGATNPDERQIQVARHFKWLLKSRLPALGPLALRDAYVVLLRERGWFKDSQLKRSEFHSSFAGWLGPNWMSHDAIRFDPMSNSSWPARVCLGKGKCLRPLRHVLLWIFLQVGPDELFGIAGDASRPRHLLARAGSRRDQQMVQKWWPKQNISLNRMARDLGRSVQTVTRWATLLHLRFPRNANDAATLHFENDRKRHRKLWLRLRDGSDCDKRRNTRRWLQRNDCSWLKRHLRKPIVVSGNPIVDWARRDEALAPKVPYLAARVRALRPFRRVSACSILQHATWGSSVISHPTRFPLTWAAIASVTESAAAYTMRRILTVRRENPHLRPHEVRERAYVPRKCINEETLAAMGYTHFRGRWGPRERKHAA